MQKLKKPRRKQQKTERNRRTTEQLEEKHKTNRNTGYPALDPTANKYLSGSGWEISVFIFKQICFSVCLRVLCFV